jgi:polyisoprenoid-binding protein YceI
MAADTSDHSFSNQTDLLMSMPSPLFIKRLLVACLAGWMVPLAGAQQAPESPALPAGGPVRGATYVVDPTHTFVIYEVGHYGTTTNRGRFSTKDGSVKIDASGRTGTVDITMDIATINTGVDALNRHLQSKDFFNLAAFPTGRFVAERIEFVGDKVRSVPGALTLLGTTRPVTLRADRFNCYLSPVINRQVCGGDFEATIKRSDFGINWGLNFGFEDHVRLLVQIEAVIVQ